MDTILRQALSGTAALCIAGFAPTLHAAEGDGWEWVVAPYLWGSSVRTDLRTDRLPSGGGSLQTSFGDIVDKLDGAFQIHVDGQRDRFGMFADFTYLGLADELDLPNARLVSDQDTRLFEIAAVWNPNEGRFRGLEVFAGLRYFDVDLTVRITPADPLASPFTVDASETYSDLMLGARYHWALSERWRLTLRGDGSLGDTEGTWNTSAVFGYRTNRGAWLLGYRYLDIALEPGNNEVDSTMHGPLVGYGFVF